MSLSPPAPGWTLFPAPVDAGSQPRQVKHPARAAPGRDRAGSVLAGQWELIRRLGFGGMGEVYESFCRADRRRYAVKLLAPDMADDPTALARFRHEFLALSQANAPGVVRAHALFEADGELFYSMELLVGRNLEEVIRRERLPPARVLEIGIEICASLSALHGRGIIHRDIKPANIVVLDDGGVRLVDLGIGKLLPRFYAGSGEGRTPPEKRLQTQPGVKMGTAGYIAPEASLGEPASPRQDVFSLGVTLFQVATRQLPFPPAAVPGAIAEPRSAAELGVDLPRVVETVLRRALIVDPAHRLQTMGALREELEGALDELRADDPDEHAGNASPDARRSPRRTRVVLTARGVTTAITVFYALAALGGARVFASIAARQPEGDEHVVGASIAFAGLMVVLWLVSLAVLHRQRRLALVAGVAVVCTTTTAFGVVIGAAYSRGSTSVLLPVAIEVGRALRFRGEVDAAAVSAAGPADGLAPEEAAAVAAFVDADEVAAVAEDAAVEVDEPVALAEAPADATTEEPPRRRRASMDAALVAAKPGLRGCAGLGDGNLFIEFIVESGGTSFAAVTPIDEDQPALLRCVRRVTSPIRFKPAEAQTFIEEYHP